MRFAAAFVLLVHGTFHLPGFLVPWRLVELEAVPYGTALFAGRIDVGDVRIVALLWLAMALNFGAAAVGAAVRSRWWVPLALGTAIFSLAVCFAGFPVAWFGIAMDLAILCGLVIAIRGGRVVVGP